MLALAALAALPLLAHPTDVQRLGGRETCSASYGLADALAYAVLAGVVTLLVLGAVRLVRLVVAGSGSWPLTVTAFVLLLLGLGTRTSATQACASINFGFVSEPSPWPALGLALLAVLGVLAGTRLVGRLRP